MKIAIIGTGISGLTCGYHLHKKHDVTLFEKADYIGGHTNTITVAENQKNLPIDTGFIVFNQRTYPNFIKILNELKVDYQPTQMSFSVKCEDTGLEYSGSNLNSLFAQRSNILKPSFLKMLKGIMDFNRKAKEFLRSPSPEISLGEFVKKTNMNPLALKYYLVPMTAAVWSADPKQMLNFPAVFMLRFCENHGLLDIKNRPQWYVIKGGSRSYIDPLTQGYKESILLSTPVTKVRRSQGKVIVSCENRTEEVFDKVIFATHTDQALNSLEDPSTNEIQMLESIPYQQNVAVLHKDSSVMPHKKRAWAAWNYHLSQSSNTLASLTYNMNILQSLECQETYNVTLNPPFAIAKEKVIKTIEYHHPVFKIAGIEEQKRYNTWIGQDNTYYCGAYLRNGFHEDGVVTAQRVCKHIEEQA